MKRYKLNTKRFLEQANWEHLDFPATARFLASNKSFWMVDESMLEEKDITSGIDDLLK